MNHATHGRIAAACFIAALGTASIASADETQLPVVSKRHVSQSDTHALNPQPIPPGKSAATRKAPKPGEAQSIIFVGGKKTPAAKAGPGDAPNDHRIEAQDPRASRCSSCSRNNSPFHNFPGRPMKRSLPAILMFSAAVIVWGPTFAQSPVATAQPAPPASAAPAAPPALDLGDCPDAAGSFELGKSYVCSCPPSAADGSPSGPVYGSLVYANDSNICTAAVHAGALKTATAGRVLIQMLDSPPVFKGTTQNGVKSEVWATATAAAFQFAPAAKL